MKGLSGTTGISLLMLGLITVVPWTLPSPSVAQTERHYTTCLFGHNNRSRTVETFVPDISPMVLAVLSSLPDRMSELRYGRHLAFTSIQMVDAVLRGIWTQ